MAIFCNTQTIVEIQYFSMMKEAYNMEFCTNLGRWGSQKSQTCLQVAGRAKPGSECYVTDWFIVMIAGWCEYSTQLDAVVGLPCRKEQYGKFASINHRQSSNLGFRTLLAEN